MGIIKTVSDLTAPAHLCIPVLHQPDDMATSTKVDDVTLGLAVQPKHFVTPKDVYNLKTMFKT